MTWKQIKLGEIAEFRNGINYTKDNFGEGLKVINVGDFKNYFKANLNELDEIKPDGIIRENDYLKGGDIIFVRSNGNRNLIGRSLFIENLNELVCHSAFTIKTRFISDKVSPKFYAYLFRSSIIRQTLSAQGNGTNISNLNQTILNNLDIPFPPLETQQKIADVLSNYDDLIENNKRRIVVLEETARRVYEEWFVKFRFPGYEKCRMVESEVGLVPDGWEIRKIEDVLTYHIGGGWGQGEQSASYPIPAYVIRGTDIPAVRQTSMGEAPLRFHKESNFNSRRIKSGDIVLEVSGGSPGQPVGRSVIVNDSLLEPLTSPVMHASFCKIMRVNKTIYSPELLQFHLSRIYDSRHIMKYQTQSTGITNFKFTFFIEDEKILVMPRELQSIFQKIISPIHQQVQNLGLKNLVLGKTRDLLLPKLVFGDVDVSHFPDIETI
jgi:type I restriction enzyme S subunit